MTKRFIFSTLVNTSTIKTHPFSGQLPVQPLTGTTPPLHPRGRANEVPHDTYLCVREAKHILQNALLLTHENTRRKQCISPFIIPHYYPISLPTPRLNDLYNTPAPVYISASATLFQASTVIPTITQIMFDIAQFLLE